MGVKDYFDIKHSNLSHVFPKLIWLVRENNCKAMPEQNRFLLRSSWKERENYMQLFQAWEMLCRPDSSCLHAKHFQQLLIKSSSGETVYPISCDFCLCKGCLCLPLWKFLQQIHLDIFNLKELSYPDPNLCFGPEVRIPLVAGKGQGGWSPVWGGAEQEFSCSCDFAMLSLPQEIKHVHICTFSSSFHDTSLMILN